MTTRQYDALNEWLRNRGRIVTPPNEPEAEPTPDPVRYAAGSCDGGKGGAPIPPDPHKRINDAMRQAADVVKGRRI